MTKLNLVECYVKHLLQIQYDKKTVIFNVKHILNNNKFLDVFELTELKFLLTLKIVLFL